ncbi:MAG: hypothetical protein C3F13_11865 [Anaerolineales bacterium]|nr:hypothetical protein [Anaerolineae bacterium]PWB52218.1 MAG: hypothetical protein C3F13_11865 [Anaerolineales bacterium]
MIHPIHLSAINGPASGYLVIVLGFLALLVIDLIIALVEGVSLTLLKWYPFRTSLLVSIIMNIISGIINGVLLILLQKAPVIWLPCSFLISILLETFIMTFFKRDALRKNSLYALIANLISYVLLILPAYYFGVKT